MKTLELLPITKEDILNALPESVTIEGEAINREVFLDGKKLSPVPSQKLRNHSPDAFNWGYGGSGPAQLSLAILLHYLPSEAALKLYQDFKFNVVASWPVACDFEKTVRLREIIQKIIER